MGYINADENYKRLQKFKDNHISQVVQDYIDNPIKEAEPARKPVAPINHDASKPETLETLLNKLPAHEKDTMSYLMKDQ